MIKNVTKNVTNFFAQRNESISHYTTRKTTVSSAVHDKPLKPSLQQNPPPATLSNKQDPLSHLDCKPPERPDKIFTYQSAGLF